MPVLFWQVFQNLSVLENLLATATNCQQQGASWTLNRRYDVFPVLAVRSGNMAAVLSSGDQSGLNKKRNLLDMDEAMAARALSIRE